MLIDDIYKKVKTFVNTDVMGNVSPAEFNLFLHNAIIERYEELNTDINKHQNRNNRGLSDNASENTTEQIRAKRQHYSVIDQTLSGVSPGFSIPLNIAYIESGYFNDKEVEFCNNERDFKIKKSVAIIDYPIALMYAQNIKVHPEVTGVFKLSYFRKPNKPNWTYQVFQGAEIFDPTHPNFRDADIHVTEENEIVRRVLKYFGINLKETDITNFAIQSEQMQNQTDLQN
jgi:hypothetical protein